MLDGYKLAASFLIENPEAILLTLLGLIIGITFGALPGLTGTAGVAIFIPLTFSMDPITGIVMLAALYSGSTFGGNITAILFNTPGAPEAATVTFDGYPMTQKGLGGKALGYSVGAATMGGIFSTLVLAVLTPPLSSVALAFSAPEYFALAFMGISVISALDTKSFWKSISIGLIGLLLAVVGLDPLSASYRFTFGLDALAAGIDFMPVIIGMFAISEIMVRAETKNLGVVKFGDEINTVAVKLPTFGEWMKIKWTLVRGFLIGVIIGILPGIGATTASFVSYSEEVRWSKDSSKFGKGAVEGVVAPSIANTAAAGGSFVPLLSLGIPGSATAAVMIGGLMIHGIRPGPLMMIQQPDLVYAIFVTLFMSNIAMLFFGVAAVRVFGAALKIDYTIMAPIIAVLCTIGVFALSNSTFDVILMFVFGVIGYFFRKFGYPVAPMVIGIVLGSTAEENLRRGISMFHGDYIAMFSRPITAVLMVISILSLIFGFRRGIRKMMSSSKESK
jgi:putative tricarboxylic transport membrane protein